MGLFVEQRFVSSFISLVQLGLVWFSRVNKVSRVNKFRVGIRVSVRIRVSVV